MKSASSLLIAIDPGSNKLGVAIFEDNILLNAITFKAKAGESLARFEDLTGQFCEWMDHSPYVSRNKSAILEDPLLQGKANNVMQRFIGFLLYDLLYYCELQIPRDKIYFVHPSTVKSRFGSIDKDKLAVAAYQELNEAEQLIINPLIDSKDFDATDAIAIGLTHLRRTPHDRNNGSDEPSQNGKRTKKSKRQVKTAKKKATKRSGKAPRKRKV
jgi:hypothetical protein